MVGVSPAFVISAYSPAFTVADYMKAAPRAAALGFGAFQLEVYRPEAISEWTASARAEMLRVLDAEGLFPSQFVCHFAMADFASAEAIFLRANVEIFLRLLEVVESFPDPTLITLPVPPFDPSERTNLAAARSAFVELLRVELEATRAAGKRLALELMPHSLIGGTEGFLRLKAEAGLEDLAYNFDTGHSWARKERVELIPAQLGGAIAGTHLCDNHGNENRKLRPGAGNLDFAALVTALTGSGYRGSYDLEIICRPEELETEYRRGRDKILDLLRRTGGDGAAEDRAVAGDERVS